MQSSYYSTVDDKQFLDYDAWIQSSFDTDDVKNNQHVHHEALIQSSFDTEKYVGNLLNFVENDHWIQ